MGGAGSARAATSERGSYVRSTPRPASAVRGPDPGDPVNDSYAQGNIEALRALPLSDGAKELILGGNAARLLGLA